MNSHDPLPGKGLLGWLGRQIGYVAKAVQTPVAPVCQTIYREHKMDEQPHPTNPDLLLRRTVIDEVIVKKNEN